MKNFRLILAITIAVSLAPAFGQTAIFVSTSGDDSNIGTTWETAKATLAGALTAATGNAHIYMMVGNYACNNVIIPSGVTVTGGYANTSTGTDTTMREYPGENSRWGNATLCTILDAGQTSRVATVNTGGLLEGCILQNGKVTDLGGGVLIDGGTVMHCVLINNVALDYDNQTAKGGGAYIRNNGHLLNCVVAKNHANNGPGVAGTDGTLTNNTITANVSVANCGTVTDEDGNVYKTIMIGTQCWMAENLRVTRSVDGQQIPLGNGSMNNPSGNALVATYGYLYSWTVVMDGEQSSSANPSGVRGICPLGWHVPSQAEWTQMQTFVMNQIPYRCVNNGNNSIAKALASQYGWNYDSTPCAVGNNSSTNNVTGFNAYPAGPGGNHVAQFWSSTQTSSNTAHNIRLLVSSNAIDSPTYGYKYNTYSVRCLRD